MLQLMIYYIVEIIIKKNKIEIIKKSIVYNAKKIKNDPIFKLKHTIGCAIRKILNKKGDSFLPHLNYTFDELKQHLESQFEPWMNWQNWSTYNSETWDDNDQSTWTWNVDHIIPQAYFKYESMEDEEFKKCWALSNLRPLNAKQNVSEGKRENSRSLGIKPIKK